MSCLLNVSSRRTESSCHCFRLPEGSSCTAGALIFNCKTFYRLLLVKLVVCVPFRDARRAVLSAAGYSISLFMQHSCILFYLTYQLSGNVSNLPLPFSNVKWYTSVFFTSASQELHPACQVSSCLNKNSSLNS